MFKAIKFAYFLYISLLISQSAYPNPPEFTTDHSKITINGMVVSAEQNGFTLDYGQGLILVEMDDWDWYDESSHILPGQRVVVSGRMDVDLFETRTIEAEFVYVTSKNAFYYANDADEEYDQFLYPGHHYSAIQEGTWVTLTGKIEEINGRKLKLSSGNATLTVDTNSMDYNPIDNIGFQKLKKFDRVTIIGKLDDLFFGGKQIIADTIVSHSRDKTKKISGAGGG